MDVISYWWGNNRPPTEAESRLLFGAADLFTPEFEAEKKVFCSALASGNLHIVDDPDDEHLLLDPPTFAGLTSRTTDAGIIMHPVLLRMIEASDEPVKTEDMKFLALIGRHEAEELQLRNQLYRGEPHDLICPKDERFASELQLQAGTMENACKLMAEGIEKTRGGDR